METAHRERVLLFIILILIVSEEKIFFLKLILFVIHMNTLLQVIG